MARVEAEELHDPVKIYVASTLGLARAVEALLTSRGVNYGVQVESLGRTTLFGSHRSAAVFYVAAAQAAWCRTLLRESEVASGIVEEGD